MTRYFTYDYGARLVTEYARGGECKRCGKCCYAHIYFATVGEPIREDVKNGGDSTTGEGLWHVVEEGDEQRCYQVTGVKLGGQEPCIQLTPEGLCAGYPSSSWRKGICIDWPMGPECIVNLPGCGFTFTAIAQWELLENNTLGKGVVTM